MYEYNEKDLEEGWGIEENNECPICKSKRISKIKTYQVTEEYNLSSGKLMRTDCSRTPYRVVFVNYHCRKCGWSSIAFDA